MSADIRGWTRMKSCYLMSCSRDGKSNFSALIFGQSQGCWVADISDTLPSSIWMLSISRGRVNNIIEADTSKLIKPSAQFQCSHATAIAARITPTDEKMSATACRKALLRFKSP